MPKMFFIIVLYIPIQITPLKSREEFVTQTVLNIAVKLFKYLFPHQLIQLMHI